MAEYSERLTLALQLEGQERIEMLSKAIQSQKLTVAELAVAHKQLKTAIDQEYTAMERDAGMAQEFENVLKSAKNTSGAMSERVQSDNAAMKDSYFRLGEEIRGSFEDKMKSSMKGMRFEHRLASRSIEAMGQVMGEQMAGPMTAFSGSLLSMNFAIKGLANGLTSAGGAVGGQFAGALMSATLPIAGLIAGAIQLISYLKSITEESAKAAAKLYELQVAGGLVTPGAQMAKLQYQKGEQEKKLKELEDRREYVQKSYDEHPGNDPFGLSYKLKMRSVAKDENELKVQMQETSNAITKLQGKMQDGLEISRAQAAVGKITQEELVKRLKVAHDLSIDEMERLSLEKEYLDIEKAITAEKEKQADEAAKDKATKLENRVKNAEANAKLEKGSVSDILAALDAQIAGTAEEEKRNELLVKRKKLEDDYAKVLAVERSGQFNVMGMGVDLGPRMASVDPTARGLAVPTGKMAGIAMGEDELTKRTGVGKRTIADDLRDAKLATAGFDAAYSHLNQTMSSQAASTISKGFIDAFGIGHTLLGQFAQDFVDTFMKLAASNVVKGLFSLIPGVGGLLGGGGLFGLLKSGGGGAVDAGAQILDGGMTLGGGGAEILDGGMSFAGGGALRPVLNAATGYSGGGTDLSPVVDALNDFNGRLNVRFGYDALVAGVDRGKQIMQQRRAGAQ